LVHKNIFCGASISLVVTEDFLDIDRSNVTADDLTSEIILKSVKLLKCTNCGRLIFLNETKETHEIHFYLPDED